MKTIAQKEERKQPKTKTEMNGKGLTVHTGLLPAGTDVHGKVVIQVSHSENHLQNLGIT